MAEKVLIIYNPMAGRGLFLSHLAEVVELCTRAGLAVEVYPTQKQGDAIEKSASLPPYIDQIIVAGGDGTLDEVVTGLVRGDRDVPIGYIPMGSTNDFAQSLGISTNIVEATGDILGGVPRGIDVGRFNDDSFVYVAAFGAFTEVAYTTGQEIKNQIGHLAYLLEGVRHLGDIKGVNMRVEANGKVREGKYIFGMISNSLSVGGFKGLAGNNLYLNDGIFEVTLIHEPKGPLEYQDVIGSLLLNNPSPLIDSFETSRLTLTSKRRVPWTLDGEFGGKHREVQIEVKKEGIRMLLGENAQHLL